MSKDQTHGSMLVLATAIAVLACLEPSRAAHGQASEPSTNLARNPSFELAASNSAIAAEWNGTPQVYSLDTAVAWTGKASLKYVNQDPQRYVLCTQKVPIQPGWKCCVSVWIKTQDIAGDESGATICLEWQGKDGKWLGGMYPTGIKGTRAHGSRLYLFAVNDGDGEGKVGFTHPEFINQVVQDARDFFDG